MNDLMSNISISNFNLAFFVFAIIKLIGYFLFLKMILKKNYLTVLKISFVRLLLGMGVGVLMLLSVEQVHLKSYEFYLILLFVRDLEWWCLFYLFDRNRQNRFELALYGTTVSCILDIPALLGFVSIHGLIC